MLACGRKIPKRGCLFAIGLKCLLKRHWKKNDQWQGRLSRLLDSTQGFLTVGHEWQDYNLFEPKLSRKLYFVSTLFSVAQIFVIIPRKGAFTITTTFFDELYIGHPFQFNLISKLIKTPHFFHGLLMGAQVRFYFENDPDKLFDNSPELRKELV